MYYHQPALTCYVLYCHQTSLANIVYFRSLHIAVKLMLANIARFNSLCIIISLTLVDIVRFDLLHIVVSLGYVVRFNPLPTARFDLL